MEYHKTMMKKFEILHFNNKDLSGTILFVSTEKWFWRVYRYLPSSLRVIWLFSNCSISSSVDKWPLASLSGAALSRYNKAEIVHVYEHFDSFHMDIYR